MISPATEKQQLWRQRILGALTLLLLAVAVFAISFQLGSLDFSFLRKSKRTSEDRAKQDMQLAQPNLSPIPLTKENITDERELNDATSRPLPPFSPRSISSSPSGQQTDGIRPQIPRVE